MVVHRQAEQDHEQEQRHPVGDPAAGDEVELLLEVPVLEDVDQHAVGRGDREQVEHHAGDRDHDRPERDQQEQERQPEHEAEHPGQAVVELMVEVGIRRGLTGDQGGRAGQRAERGGDDAAAQGVQGGHRRTVIALSDKADRDHRDRAGGVDLDVDRLDELTARLRLGAEPRERLLEPVTLDRGALDDDPRGRGLAREGLGDRLQRLHDRLVGRQVLDALRLGLQVQRRGRQRAQCRHRDQHRDQRLGQHDLEQATPEPAVTATPVEPRDLDRVDPVTERREQGRQHGQRTQDRGGDHQDGAQPEADERGVVGEEHAGHRHDHGEAGDPDRPAGGLRGDHQRPLRIGAVAALVPLPADVEEAVVHPDREADQQHHVRGGVDRRRQPAEPGHQADRRDHRGHRQADRQQRGHHRAERHQQDAERDRDGEHREPGETRVELVADQLVAAGVTALGDEQIRVRGLHLRHRVQRRADPVLRGLRVALDAERDQRRVLVRRLDRILHVGDVTQPGQRLGDLTGGRGPIGARPVLDQHHLAGRLLREARPLDDLLGPARVTVALVRIGRREAADHAAEDRGGDHECDPTQDRECPVSRAPDRDARCDPFDFPPVLHA